VTSPWPGSFRRLLALLAVAGCEHSEPFGSRSFDTDQPFDPTPPVRLTLNRGPDRRAAWLPDGSAILYSTQLVGRRDNDVCLAALPPTGGIQRSLTCDLSPSGAGTTDALESAAPAEDGRLAFVAATSGIGELSPEAESIVLASVDHPASRRVLRTVPYTIPGNPTHGGVSQLRWLGPNRLLYLGELVVRRQPCAQCQYDTLRSGLDVVWLDVDDPAASPQALPGTDFASGVSPGSSADEIYYTLGGDARVYRQLLSTGAVSVVRDFGAAGIARDVHVLGNRMAVVVGGRVAFGVDPLLGPAQWDSGGVLHVVNLQDGTAVALEGPGLVRRPQLSPSGTAVIAELYPLIITTPVDGIPIPDTTVSRVGDLYLFGQP
jgi:hypothetical protein